MNSIQKIALIGIALIPNLAFGMGYYTYPVVVEQAYAAPVVVRDVYPVAQTVYVRQPRVRRARVRVARPVQYVQQVRQYVQPVYQPVVSRPVMAPYMGVGFNRGGFGFGFQVGF